MIEIHYNLSPLCCAIQGIYLEYLLKELQIYGIYFNYYAAHPLKLYLECDILISCCPFTRKKNEAGC